MPHSPIHTLKAHFPQCFDKNGDLMPHKLQEAILDLAQENQAKLAQQSTTKQKDNANSTAQSDTAQDLQEQDSREKDAILSLSKETYTLNWLGKSYAKLLRHLPTDTLIAQDLAHNAKAEHKNSKNVLIKGDNLEVLKHLKNAYYNKIKMIYIDPPYNTGNDGFIYNDERNFTPQSLAQMANIEIDEANKILNYTLKNSSTHSAWLSFMYPRLYIARQLLRDDGVIFISIDDNEQANLKILCDEIFGEDNFVANIIWNHKYTVSNDTDISNQCEYVLCYSKNRINFKVGLLPRTQKQDKAYKNRDNDPKGAWKATPIHARGGSENSDYIITFPNGFVWNAPAGRHPRYSKENLLNLYKNGELYFNNNGGVDRKTYLSEVKQGVTCGTMWQYDEVGHTHGNNEEFANIIGKGIFNDPKGTKLLKRILKISTTPNNPAFTGGGGERQSANSARELDSTHSTHPLAPLVLREGESPKNESLLDCHTERSEVSQDSRDCRDFSHSTNAQNDKNGDISLDAQYDKDKSRDISFATQTQYDKGRDKQTQYDDEPDIILDFFAGSGTTAHAVMELNAQDNGNRQFILVQLDEKIDSAKSKVAYDFCKNELGSENPTIFDITKERIKRASAKIAQSPNTHANLDLGFKVYEIRKNNLQSNNDSLFDSIKLSDDDKNALLESFKLQDSLPLTLQNHRVDLGGYEGILAGEKLYLLNPNFETKHLQNLIEKIDTQKDFVIKEISYLNNVFDSAKIREIEEGIASYANKKGLKILVRARFI